MNLFKLFFKKNKIEDKKQSVIKNEIINDTSNHPEWDEVFYARTTNDLNKMLQVVNLKTNSVNRHFLLQAIVNESYKLREQENFKSLCLEYSAIHLNEFQDIAPALKKDMDGMLPRVSTFQNYATLLTELGEFEKAISVCEKAISYGLSDGTKSDYEGRIQRIKKKTI